MALDDDLCSSDRLSFLCDIIHGSEIRDQKAEVDREMHILHSEYKCTETAEPWNLDKSSFGESSTDTNKVTCLQHEMIDTDFQPFIKNQLKMTRKRKAVSCSGCQKVSLPNQACSCPFGHMLCHFCVQKEVQDMLLGDKKARKLKCSIPHCERYLSEEELCKVLPPFTIQLIERKVDKEYLQYIKSWFLTSYSTKFQTREEFAISSLQSAEEPKEKWPQYWIPMREGQPTTVYKVQQGSDEYAAQATAFHDSLEFPDFDIVAIYRIQNPILWKFYSLKRSQMMVENNNKDVCERKLYHGTVRRCVAIIAEKGFDWRLCGKNATVYGQGTYFAKSALVSHPYTFNSKSKMCSKCKINCGSAQSQSLAFQPPLTPSSSTGQTEDAASAFVRDPSSNTHFMFAAHVLVGQFTRGRSSFRRPPPVDAHNPFGKLYDSCVDSVQDPEKFVVFDHNQAYPMYVVEYAVLKI